jgi:tetratricopeptide (TPR) repeat protein
VAAASLAVRAAVAYELGDSVRSYTLGHQALAAYRHVDDPSGTADCLVTLGGTCMWRWLLDEAMQHYREAHELYRRTGDRYHLGATLRGMGNVRACEGDLSAAEELLHRAADSFLENGNRYHVATCLNDLGEVARLGGDLATAEELYRRAAALYESLGAADASTPRFNLGMVLLARGRWAEAKARIGGELDRIAGQERTIDHLWLYMGMLCCAAAERDWSGWDVWYGRVRDRLEGDFVDEDLATLAELAADQTRSAGELWRSRWAYELARSLWRRIGKLDRVETIDEALRELDLDEQAAEDEEAEER